MPEYTFTQPVGDCGPACENDSLIIEVIGQDRAEEHSFRIYDESNYEQQEWLENQVSLDELDGRVLHVWPWSNQPARNIWLDIEAEEGASVRVPLFEAVFATERQMKNQWNRILPMVPLTLIHDPDPAHGHPNAHLVPVRPGFIYVFRKGRLWRELEVRYSDSKIMEFVDVRLLDYRSNGQSELKKDRRPAVGKPQRAIWLPVSEMNRSVLPEFQMAFSEVQWSSQRVAHLENVDSARAERCQTLKGPIPTPKVASWLSDQHTPGQLISLLQLPGMRLRESYLEQHLPQPWKSVYDLEGHYAKNLYDQAREEAHAFAANKESAEQAWEIARYQDAPLRRATAARAAAFITETFCNEKNTIWQTLGPNEDILADLQARGYGGIILEDRLFTLRHHLVEALEAQRLLSGLLEAIGQKPHSDSAQLVYRLLGPKRLGRQANPLHHHLEEIDTSLFGPLHSHLLTAQRQLARESLADAQKQLTNLVGQAVNQNVLADVFSLSGCDYIEGFCLTQDLFHVLAMNPNGIDHLARVAPASEAQVRNANELVLKIVEEGSNQPLHKMLFPSEQPPGADCAVAECESNGKYGDGRCRPADLENLPDQLPHPDKVQTLTPAALAGLVKTDAIDLSSEYKRWMGAVGAILDGIDKHVRALVNRLQSRTYRLDSRLYGPLLRMAKARAPAVLGSVQLVVRNAVPQGWIILGLSDPAAGLEMGLTKADREYIHKANGHRRFYGEYLDAEGQPLASTRKSAIPNLANTAEAREFHVYAAPETSEVVRTQRDMRRLKRLDDFLGRVRVPYLVLVLEVHNILTEASQAAKIRSEKGRLRAGAGVTSAFADLIFAGTIAAERLSVDLGIWKNTSARLGETAFTINSEIIGKASVKLADALPRVVSRRLLGGIVTAGLTITVSLLDMAHEWDTGDMDTAAAYGASAVGGGMMLMGGLMMVKMTEAGIAPILLGLGPWGWVVAGATLTVGAGLLVVMLDDPPLVDWLKRGPFGPEQDNAYPHLAHNPAETYYRLVGLLTKPRITIEHAHNMSARLAKQGLSIDSRQDRAFAKINTVVRVENNLAAMLNVANLTVAMRPVQITRQLTRRGARTQRKTLQESPTVVLEQTLLNGKAYYLALPPRETFTGIWGRENVKTSEVLVRAQWHCSWDDGRVSPSRIFPAPELHDPVTFELGTHGKPVFLETGQLFWADEQTHKAVKDT